MFVYPRQLEQPPLQVLPVSGKLSFRAQGAGSSLDAATAHHSGTFRLCSPLSKRRSLRITSNEFRIDEFASLPPSVGRTEGFANRAALVFFLSWSLRGCTGGPRGGFCPRLDGSLDGNGPWNLGLQLPNLENSRYSSRVLYIYIIHIYIFIFFIFIYKQYTRETAIWNPCTPQSDPECPRRHHGSIQARTAERRLRSSQCWALKISSMKATSHSGR